MNQLRKKRERKIKRNIYGKESERNQEIVKEKQRKTE